MHELSIMQSALDMVLEKAREARACHVCAIHLRIGALSGVVPEALRFAFDALTPGTIAEGAELVIAPVPARFWCGACEREFESEDLFAECPQCSRPSGQLRAGRELEISAMEIE